MNKKIIIGYVLKDKKYANFASKLIGHGIPLFLDTIIKNESNISKLKEADVLDVWFEPVFESEFKKGDLVWFKSRLATLKGLITPVWFNSGVIKVESVYGNSLRFTIDEIRKAGICKPSAHIAINPSNSVSVFRKATKLEIDNYNSIEVLPKINNYYGEIDVERNVIKYGCAELNIEWFEISSSRVISELTLNSGIKISCVQMSQIREVLKFKNLI